MSEPKVVCKATGASRGNALRVGLPVLGHVPRHVLKPVLEHVLEHVLGICLGKTKIMFSREKFFVKKNVLFLMLK